MIRLRHILPLLCLTALPAGAQGLGDAISTEGRLALGWSDRVPGAEGFLVGDAMLRFQPAFTGPLGVELGIYGRADALDTPHETYGALTWDFGPDTRAAAGAVRPAYDRFAVSALERSFPSLGVDRAGTTRSAATAGAMWAGWVPWGVSLTHQAGDLRYAASIQHASGPDRTVYGLGAETGLGAFQLSGAIEAVSGGGTDLGAKLQLSGPLGPAEVGLGFYSPATPGSPDVVELFGDLNATDRLSLSAVVQVPTEGGADPTAGVAARYGFTDNLGVSLGVASDAGSDAVVEAFVDFRF